RALSEQGPSTATGLAANLPVTRQAVAKHMAALAEAGLVTATRRGREVLYQLSPRPLSDAVSWMADLGARWDERLAALRDHVARAKRRRGAAASRRRAMLSWRAESPGCSVSAAVRTIAPTPASVANADRRCRARPARAAAFPPSPARSSATGAARR